MFFVLGPLGLWFSGKKIRRERVRKAKESLVDLLEGMVVNQAKADEAKLQSILRAIERDVDIDLAGEYSIDEWLGDVVLRFEKSRHLSANQKQEYYEAVAKISEDMRARDSQKKEQNIPREYQPIINDLQTALNSSEINRATSLLQELEQRLSRRQPSQDPLLNILGVYKRLYQRSPVTFLTVTAVVTVLYLYIILRWFPFIIWRPFP